MRGADLRDSLLALSGALNSRELSLRIDCENLETVYASVERGRLTLSDRRETFGWLERSGRPVSLEEARGICAPYEVAVAAVDPECFPRLETAVADDEPVQRALDRVAAAIDAVFAAAAQPRSG
jgi:hypothetical protein